MLYAAVFKLTQVLGQPLDLALWALANALPHVLLAIPLVERVGPRMAGMKGYRAAIVGAVAAVAYAAAAYAATIFLLALTARVEAEGLWVRFFQGPALSWQTFQALTYALLALVTGQMLALRRDRDAVVAEGPKPARPQRWLVKTADGIVPVEPHEIVRIEAQGEYVRLVLGARSVLSRISLGECAERLRGLAFLRVHRSHLVNADAIVRAESAGNGRMQLTVQNGDQVITRREGARLVREAAI